MDKCSQAPFAHRFPTLIHPLPTLRRVRKELTSGFFNNNIFLKEQSQNTALVLNLILAFNSPMVGVHLSPTNGSDRGSLRSRDLTLFVRQFLVFRFSGEPWN
jgi:hypothetical protein